MQYNQVMCADSLQILKEMEPEKIDLIYMDPPFFTQETQRLTGKNQEIQYAFSDKWKDMNAYLEYMKVRLTESRRVLKDTGSIFVHCDRNASHYLKVLMDSVFGIENFKAKLYGHTRDGQIQKKGY